MPAPALCIVSGVLYTTAGAPAANVSLYLKRAIKDGVLIATAPALTANVPQLNGGYSTISYITEIISDGSGVVTFSVPRASTVYFEGNASGFNNGEIALVIPNTATANLEDLVPATFPITSESLSAAVDARIKLLQKWALNFTGNGDIYLPAYEAMTIDIGVAAIGTGTLAYTKSSTALPSTFNATTLPTALEAGAWLKISVSAISGFKAVELKRTA